MLNDFISFLGGEFRPVTEDDVFAYFDRLNQRVGSKGRRNCTDKLSGNTIRTTIFALKSMYDELVKRRKIPFNPFLDICSELPSARNNEKRPTELVPFETVLALCNSPSEHSNEGIRDRGILAALFGGALRKSEAIGLKLCDVRCFTEADGLTHFYIYLAQTKSGIPQEQRLPFWAVGRIMQVLKARKREGASLVSPLFTSYYRDGRISNEHLTDRTFDRMFRKWCDDVGLPASITPHSARATALAYLVSKGLSVRDVQKHARHASVVSTEGYLRFLKHGTVAEHAVYDESYVVTKKGLDANQSLEYFERAFLSGHLN